jgi:23S rRNA-/tRNA-specific pseudouridylate synthase
LAARVAPDAGIPNGEPYLGVHQRLDRDTSGIVLFTKHAAANRSLADSFARGSVRKTYRALTRRPRKLPPPSWTVETRLGTVGKGRVASVTTGGVPAHTELARLEVYPAGLLVEARPLTGRKHQIRVHLAEAGLPILGDTAYGGSGGSTEGGGRAGRAMLHAARLVFPHPRSGQDVVIECPDPPDFAAMLERLRGNRRGRPPGQVHPVQGKPQRH